MDPCGTPLEIWKIEDAALSTTTEIEGCTIYNICCSHDRQTVHDRLALSSLQPSRYVF